MAKKEGCFGTKLFVENQIVCVNLMNKLSQAFDSNQTQTKHGTYFQM